MAEQVDLAPDQKTPVAQSFLAVTEEELQHIVLNIHDGPVQYIFAALSEVKLLQQRQTLRPAQNEQQLARIATILEAALRDMRNFLGAFRSPDFQQRSLAEVIRNAIMQHEEFTGCQVVYVVDKRPLPASLPVKIALYRICQEALTNAYRHSGTTEQRVHLSQNDKLIQLEIRDEGNGFISPPLFGPSATERTEHIGLRGMRERTKLVNGELELETAPGKGTHIVVKVPRDE
jgi:signal transduction histidine kinase